MIQKQPHSYPVDIWSFAICVMELCDGEPPNRKSSVRAMFLVGIGEPPKLKSEKNYSKSIHDFLEKCLVIDPAKRWSAKQLLNVKQNFLLLSFSIYLILLSFSL